MHSSSGNNPIGSLWHLSDPAWLDRIEAQPNRMPGTWTNLIFADALGASLYSTIYVVNPAGSRVHGFWDISTNSASAAGNTFWLTTMDLADLDAIHADGDWSAGIEITPQKIMGPNATPRALRVFKDAVDTAIHGSTTTTSPGDMQAAGTSATTPYLGRLYVAPGTAALLTHRTLNTSYTLQSSIVHEIPHF